MAATAREKIIDRIHKLLALSADTDSEAEAAAAALQAQRLIARHDVIDAELSEGELGEVTEVGAGWCDNERWRGWLACAVAENFRCKNYSMIGRGLREDVFVGHELDARAATLTYQHLAKVALRQARRLEREHRSMYGTAAGVRLTYMHGFVDGIREELERGTKALMLVRQPDVDTYFEELERTLVKARAPRKVHAPVGMHGIIDRGRSDGREAVRRSRHGSQAVLAAGRTER